MKSLIPHKNFLRVTSTMKQSSLSKLVHTISGSQQGNSSANQPLYDQNQQGSSIQNESMRVSKLHFHDWQSDFNSSQVDPLIPQLYTMQHRNTGEWAREFNSEGSLWRQQFSNYRHEPMANISEIDHGLTLNPNHDWNTEFQKYTLDHANSNITDENVVMENTWSQIKSISIQDEDTDFGNVWDQINSNSFEGDEWKNDFETMFPGISNQPYLQEMEETDPFLAPFQEYFFELNNPFLSSNDPLTEGKRILASNGPLTIAALAFEAAVQRDSEDAYAWMMLGKTHAENEKENCAISALQRSIQLDPKNSDALMSLSVSYINEGLDMKAYCCLARWIQTNYPGIGLQTGAKSILFSGVDDANYILQQAYIEAAQSTKLGRCSISDLQTFLYE